MEVKKIIDQIDTFRLHHYPNAFLFDSGTKQLFDQAVSELSDAGFNFLDINQYVAIKPTDYDVKIADLGYHDDTGKHTLKDVNLDDASKRRLICRGKLKKLQDIIDEKTILLITYNDLYLHDETFSCNGQNILYETMRHWLKDGYPFSGKSSKLNLVAFVYLETQEKIQDFCMYGAQMF